MDESAEINISQFSLSEFQESSQNLVTSTPSNRNKGRNIFGSRLINTSTCFRSPRKITINAKTRICKECGKAYSSEHHFKNHVRLHSVEEVVQFKPPEEEVLENIHVLDQEVLQKCSTSLCFGPKGQHFKDLVEAITIASNSNSSWQDYRTTVCQYLMASTLTTGFLLPSQLSSHLLRSVEGLLSCGRTRTHLAGLVRDLIPQCDLEVVESFTFLYIMKFTQALITFLSLSLRKDNVSVASRNICLDKEDEEVILYCAGSVLKGFLRMGRKMSSNAAWKRISTFISTKLLEHENSPQASEDQRRWIQSIDRGGLIIINAEALKFFVSVAKSCAQCEEVDGSLPYETILKTLFSDGTAAKWDDIVSDSLSPKESLSLMYGVIRSFCQTCGRGIAKRHLNRLRGNKATASLSLRHQVAPK